MNSYLLDTNIVLLALTAPEHIPARVRSAIEQGGVFLSVLSYWEVLLKSMKGKLEVGDPRVWWQDAVDQLAGTPLMLRPDHLAEIYSLPAIHQDPFYRALLAQAIVDGLTLVTCDAAMAAYASERLRILTL